MPARRRDWNFRCAGEVRQSRGRQPSATRGFFLGVAFLYLLIFVFVLSRCSALGRVPRRGVQTLRFAGYPTANPRALMNPLRADRHGPSFYTARSSVVPLDNSSSAFFFATRVRNLCASRNAVSMHRAKSAVLVFLLMTALSPSANARYSQAPAFCNLKPASLSFKLQGEASRDAPSADLWSETAMAHWLFKSEPSAWSYEKVAGLGPRAPTGAAFAIIPPSSTCKR